jgi:hypothetical protein
MPAPIADLVSSLMSAIPPSVDEMPIPDFSESESENFRNGPLPPAEIPVDDNFSLISGLSQDDIQSL